MQLVWMMAAGGILAAAYLATLHALLFGRDGSRTSPLLTMTCFIASSGVALVVLDLLAGGRAERLVAALAGFLVSRALLGKPLLGPWEGVDPDYAREHREPLGQQPLDRLA